MSLGWALFLFALSTLVVTLAGIKLSGVADRLADATGLGEAIFGGVLLGLSTSISGVMVSTWAAFDGHTDLAISNAVGGIAGQTFFLCVADIFYRKANLEHAAASSTNILTGVLLIALLVLPILGARLPDGTFFGIHPLTVVLFATYVFGVYYANSEKKSPMWQPENTKETSVDEPSEEDEKFTATQLWLRFIALALVLALCGYGIKTSALAIAAHTGLSETILGAILTSLTTSLPELVTTLAAVRRGALTLAVSGIIGGNTFDILFLAFSDVAYRGGSLYHHLTDRHEYLICLTILMTAFTVMGLVRRERHGFANIGWETILSGGLYIVGMGYLVSVS